jgi:hypothetical protein
LVLAHTGHAEEALREFRIAGCGEADAHSNLAFALSLENHPQEARAQYELALAADPTSASVKKRLQELTVIQAKAESVDTGTANLGAPSALPGNHAAAEEPAPQLLPVPAEPELPRSP